MDFGIIVIMKFNKLVKQLREVSIITLLSCPCVCIMTQHKKAACLCVFLWKGGDDLYSVSLLLMIAGHSE